MALPKKISELTDSVESAVDSYASGLTPIQKSIYNKVLALLKNLSIDTEGNIKTTINNYKIITQVKNIIKRELNSDAYLNHVSKINDHYVDISSIQDNYFTSMFSDFSAPKVIETIQKQAIDNTVESLTESGINEVLVKKVTGIVGDNIKSGSNFTDMTSELEDFILGTDEVDGKLVSYSKQIVNDALSQYAGNYHQIVTDDLGLKWYGFVGGLVRDSRPMCRALVAKKYIHESEIKGICRGIVDGKEVGTDGFIPYTDESNFMINRCGYNCGHQVIPISDEFVPEKIRKEFEE